MRVTNDHETHEPRGPIDMHGESDNPPYEIVAAAAGTIRFIEDSFSQRLNCCQPSEEDPDCVPVPQENNYVWIEHADGEWTKYSHMEKNSVTGAAGLSVGQFVKAGAFLGYESDVGCASGPHLHFEVGVPRAKDPIYKVGGFLKDNTNRKRNRAPRICGIPGGIFTASTSYNVDGTTVPSISPGFAEVARHGVPARDYQCLFEQATHSGYELEWVDGFDIDGKVFFNAIFRPRTSSSWVAFHGLTGSAYQRTFDKYTGKGFRPTQVESYRSGSEVRYAIILKKRPGPPFLAYHGLTPSEHQKRFDTLTAEDWRPKNISVTSIAEERWYTALYEKTDVGSFFVKSFMTPAEYQRFFDENLEQGRQVAYLNGYEHDGAPFLSAIWNSKTTGLFRARHNLTGSEYQAEWEDATAAGLSTRNVTGYKLGNSAGYAAVWRK